jgi:hypothetical protein
MDEIHFNHWLPYFDNSSYDIVLNVYLPPANIERITITIMPEENAYEAQESQEETQSLENQIEQVIVVPDYSLQDTGTIRKASPKFSLLLKTASRRAIDDVIDIKRKMRGGKYIILDPELFNDRIEEWMQRDIANDFLEEDISYPELRKEYQNAYQREFDEAIRSFAAWVVKTKDEKESRLRTTLSQDRALIRTCASGDQYARDLVLTRILQTYYPEYRLKDIDVISVLKDMHSLIDRYENYVLDFEERNEVIWPDDQVPF